MRGGGRGGEGKRRMKTEKVGEREREREGGREGGGGGGGGVRREEGIEDERWGGEEMVEKRRVKTEKVGGREGEVTRGRKMREKMMQRARKGRGCVGEKRPSKGRHTPNLQSHDGVWHVEALGAEERKGLLWRL